MQVKFQLPNLPVRLAWDTPLRDNHFERAAMEADFFGLERTKTGDVIVNPPVSAFTSVAGSEITYQLRGWWKKHKTGRVVCTAGFFLGDGSSYTPNAAYMSAQQLVGLASTDLDGFPRLCPAFVIELVSRTDRRKTVEAKMLDWIANGAQLAWLVDPYGKSVTVYEAGIAPRTTRAKIVHGTGPIAEFEFNTADVWSCYEL